MSEYKKDKKYEDCSWEEQLERRELRRRLAKSGAVDPIPLKHFERKCRCEHYLLMNQGCKCGGK